MNELQVLKVIGVLGCLAFQAAAQEPVALWAFPDAMPASQTAPLGVVAYHHAGVSNVVFTVNGAPAGTVTEETMNPDTGEMEFVLELETTNYTENALVTIGAAVYSSDPADPSNTLASRTVCIDNIPTTDIYFVDQALGSDSSGTGASNAPYATIGKALSVAASGAEVRVRDGEYDLGAGSNYGFNRFVLVHPDEGAAPKITSAGTCRTSFLHIEGLEFDWTGAPRSMPDNQIVGSIIQTSGNTHFWIENCEFYSVPNLYNNFLTALRLLSGSGMTVEGCRIYDIDLATAAPPSDAIFRKNEIGPITRDAFDFFSDVLITGNSVHDITSTHLYIETTNSEPFNVTSAGGLTFYYDEFDEGNYMTFVFPDVAALVSSPSVATAEELAQGFMANAAFADKLEATAESGYLRVTARRTNYRQNLYVIGSANAALGFPNDSFANRAYGSGQHCDIFQTWGTAQSDIIIRNNRAYDFSGQGLLPQSNIDNMVLVNNLIDDAVAYSWMLNFESKYYYRNILMANNTFWGARATAYLNMGGREDFVVMNNIFGPRGILGDDNGSGLTMDYNLYDYYAPSSGEGPAAHSLWTNPGKDTPTPTPLFENAVPYWDAEAGNWEYIALGGDFSLASNSPAINVGTVSVGIDYDIFWRPRSGTPDIGAFEYFLLDDSDSDGLPDAWEVFFFTDLTTSDGTGDEDVDGLSDHEEEVAGTDPTDSNSLFKVMEESGTNFVIRWPSAEGRLYAVDGRTNLAIGGWSNIESNIVATPPTNSYLLETATETLFNRVRVRK